ncbi:helix-turn-helix domain-containing protein [Globicatella sulfidifaciens]|uniref:DNA-binding transcriptional regulator, XRE-family HTH domain n=1 Tax=Globicatella sulfidifaciens DSM 15739 TaxID=1121925 RepID=A0A1T4L9I2_9LACT|nr:helix-turn-helix transcriptional regulator [Globicatella sulfidifaciens]SJZ51294.1 DNA-binding transcriptional regulator, XRE-family HTH domain [Globicatella sulfidifaciens DSM 15739]
MSLGENLKKIRTSKKMNQEDFANLLNISRSYLGDLENNRKNPSVQTVQKLANKLETTVYELLYGVKEEIMTFDTGEELDEFRNLIIETIKARENSNETESFINNKTTLIDGLKKEIISIQSEIDYNNYLLSKGELEPEEALSINGSLGASIEYKEEKIEELETNPKYKFYIYNNVIYVLVNKKDLTVSDINFDVSQYDNLIIEINNKEVDNLHNITNEKLINVIHLNHDWNTNLKLTYDAWFKLIKNPQYIY